MFTPEQRKYLIALIKEDVSCGKELLAGGFDKTSIATELQNEVKWGEEIIALLRQQEHH